MYTSTSARRFGLGDALDDYATGDTLANAYAADPALAQLHQLALLIVDLRGQFNTVFSQIADASLDVDPNELQVIAGQIQQYVAAFGQLRGTINAQTAQLYSLSPIDNAILAVGNWANGVGATIASAGAAVLNLPTDVANYLAQQLANIAAAAAAAAKKAGGAALGLLLPAVAVVGGLAFLAIELTKRAETTRTGKAIARRL